MFIKYKCLQSERSPDIVGIPPQIMTHGAACADLALPHDIILFSHDILTVDLLVAFDIPKNWCLYIQPRSSTFSKHHILMPTGIIDYDYTGPVHAQLYNMSVDTIELKKGTRLCQVQIFQTQAMELEPVNVIEDSFTRDSFIGSTGI